MNEKTKRILLIVIMIISCIGVILIVNHAKNNFTQNDNSRLEMREPNGKPSTNEQNNFNGEVNKNYSISSEGMPSELPNDEVGKSESQEPPYDKQEANFNQENPNFDKDPRYDKKNITSPLTFTHKVTLVVLFMVFSACLLYLIMSHSNKEFYKNKDKLTIYILSNIILITILSMSVIYYVDNHLVENKLSETSSSSKEEVTLNKDNIIKENNIDLNKQSTDVTITKGGSYTITGKFNNSIIIDAENEEVELILDNVEIKNENTATIIGLSAKKITINLAQNSKNSLTDGGNSKYDGCIFSNTELVFTGTGELTINGRQNEGEGIATEAQNITFNSGNYTITSNDDGINAGGDGATITINNGTFYIDASGDGIDSNKNAIINNGTIFVIGSDIGGDAGIDTDDGFTINGGTVIALGSDMIELPLNSSSQKSLAFTLDKAISKDTIVTLMKDEKEIISFQANKSFKTIIISDKKLDNGTYSLYRNGSHSGDLANGIYTNGKYTKGEKITIKNSDAFIVSKIINNFGDSSRK